ncbi:SpoIIE family protein phosphatase [Cyanobacteria bacterium FACHB-DQ100]|nr:SpoIIE family protein phosphatase [Cyanobacteria bacterium FACHB-DQ100]
MRESIAIAITESSQIGEARRAALNLATRFGFKEIERGRVGIVVTEVANNLLQHAQGGVMLLRAIQEPAIGIEVLALDQGPGMIDVNQCLQDGFSTAGTSGNGLGAVRRLSNLFEIYSIPGSGTAILMQLWSEPLSHSPKILLEIGAVCLPKRGEEVSGDAWASQIHPHRSVLLVADGLGHGSAAASASSAAVRTLEENYQRSPHEIVEAAHQALRSTRGAVLAITEINFDQRSVHYAGIGNIATSISSFTDHHNLVSHNGTVGHEVRKIQEFTHPWYPNGLLIMHSDGLATQWRLDRYPGLRQKHPSLIAGVLYRDFNRDRDDVTVLVAREAR